MASDDLGEQAGGTDIAAMTDKLLPPAANPATGPGSAAGMTFEALKQPYQDAYNAVRGRMTDDEAHDFAFNAALGMVPMGRGLATVASKVVKPAQQGIRAYHGSPHDFDKFDISRIGTGEGAQAYGHGLYFAENPKVAQEYKETLGRHAQNMSQFRADTQLKISGGDRDLAIAELLRDRARYLEDSAAYHETTEAIRVLRANEEIPKGKMYEVNINAHPDQFLPWDSKELPQHVENALIDYPKLSAKRQDQILGGEVTGKDIYEWFGNRGAAYRTAENTQRDASQRLNEVGIPGIKYLDQGSRPPMFGTWGKDPVDKMPVETRNYVLFNDKIIDILRKYGIPGLIAGGGTAATAKGNRT